MTAVLEAKRPDEAASAVSVIDTLSTVGGDPVFKNGRLYGSWDIRVNVTNGSGTIEVDMEQA